VLHPVLTNHQNCDIIVARKLQKIKDSLARLLLNDLVDIVENKKHMSLGKKLLYLLTEKILPEDFI